MKENTLTFSTGNYIMFLDISGGVWHSFFKKLFIRLQVYFIAYKTNFPLFFLQMCFCTFEGTLSSKIQ